MLDDPSEIKLPNQVYQLRQGDFGAIPGQPFVYWVNQYIRKLFSQLSSLGSIANPKVGLQTGENVRFLRFWWELGIDRIFFNKNTRNKKDDPDNVGWCLYMKGGAYQRWYGNQFHILNWKSEGAEIKSLIPKSVIRNSDCYFKEGITWSDLSTKGFGVRYLPKGFIFDVKGSSGFPGEDQLFTVMAVMNSPWMNYALGLLNPTVSFQVGDIGRVPFKMPSPSQKAIFEGLVPKCIQIQQSKATRNETAIDFTMPLALQSGKLVVQAASQCLSGMEAQLNKQVYDLFEIGEIDRQAIESELAGGLIDVEEVESTKAEEEDDTSPSVNITELIYSWLSYAIGIVLGRFQPGTPGALGSAIYRRSDFAIGSLPEPSEEEFNELVGGPSQFAYIDEQGGRHVFPRQVEQALQKLAIPDGIAVFDPNHPGDLPTLVSKALELMLGQAQAQEVIQQAAGGDLRKFLEKDFFTQHHIKQYRKRPVYWPIQSSKRSYGFVLFHEKIDRNTFYALQQEPYLPTKRRAVQLRLEELGKKVLTAQGAARKPIEKEMDELRQLAEELAQFAKDLDAITRGGYEPEADWIDDGVILRMAPLWSVIPLWKSEPKKYWEELAAGKYDWSRIAMKYWPERVKQACKKNKSYAIAHGHEEWFIGN